MGKSVLGVLAGYVVMIVVVFGLFTGAYLGMGPDRAFKPGTYDVSGIWIGLSLVVGFVAALAGGRVCAAIAGRRATRALAVLVLILGLLLAIPVLTVSQGAKPGPRAGDVPNFQAMTKAQTPAWIALLNPFVGVAGVLVGGRRKSQ